VAMAVVTTSADAAGTNLLANAADSGSDTCH
jgi:hypothetical protein